MTTPLVRPMQRAELALALDWAAREGWNPGVHDADAFFAADPEGFLLAELGGAPVGCIGAVSYARRFGVVGLAIVEPRWRGHGVGRSLWQRALARLEGLPIGLDGAPSQQEHYRRSGFEFAWRNVRYAGVARADGIDAAGTVALAAIPFAEVLADDLRVFPAPRPAFLRAWLDLPDAIGFTQRYEEGGHFVCVVVRHYRVCFRIAPLVAGNAGAAQALFRALCRRLPAGEPIELDVPQPNAAAVALAEAAGLAPVCETVRMYAGRVTPIEVDRVYGVASLELG